MPISIAADPTLAQGYIKVNGTTAATVTSTGLTTASLQDNAVTTSKVNNAAITAAKLDGAQTGSAPIYGCRAWVNFDGTRNAADTGVSVNGGTVKIRASGNVSSVVKNSVGSFTVNFATAMPDQNYSVALGQCTGSNGSIDGRQMALAAINYTAGWNSGYTVISCYNEASGAAADPVFACVSVFR